MSSPLPSNPAENRGPQLDALTIALTALAVIVVAARLWVRQTIIHNIGVDDWIMTFVTFVSILGAGVVVAEVHYGAGRHMGDIPVDDLPKGLMLNFMSQLVYLYGICFAKMAVGASLLRIASTKFWKHTIICFMIFVMVYTTAGFISILLQCTDIRTLWDSAIQASCWPGTIVQNLGYANFGLNIITDLVFALGIPLPMLWNINVNHRTKLSLFFVLGLGCFVCACAIERITLLGTYGMSGDWLWDTAHLATWSMVELNVSIIAGSLPSLKPLGKRFLGSVYTSRNTRERDYYGAGSSLRPRGQSKIRKSIGMVYSGTGNSGMNNHFTPTLPADTPSNDGGSQVQLTEDMHSHDLGYRESFELVSYKVEARRTIPTDLNSLSRDHSIKGITKTTTTTISYDEPKNV